MTTNEIPGVILTELELVNCHGIRELHTGVGPGGLILAGRTASGKTSVLKGIMALLRGAGIGAEAITIGEDRAQMIGIMSNGYTVKRTIPRDSPSTLTIKNDVATVNSPAKYLATLFASTLNPIAFAKASKADRRTMVMAAFASLRLTREALLDFVPDLDPNTSTDGNALAVIEAVRKDYYDRRTAANARAQHARAEYERALAAAAELEKTAPPVSIPIATATENLDKAKATLAGLEHQQAEARRSFEATATARAQIESLRASATTARASVQPIDAGAEGAAQSAAAECERMVADLARRLAEAKTDLAARTAMHARIVAMRESNEATERTAVAAEEKAALLAEVLGTAAAPDVDASAFDIAREAIAGATLHLRNAKASADAIEAARVAKALASPLQDADAEAARLHRIVTDLTTTLPRKLFAEHNGIPGVSLDGDEVLLDGKRFDANLSGREQLEFSVEIAKRTTARGRILVMDGLEQVDADYMPRFLQLCTRDQWQVFGTMVTTGPMRLLHVQADGDVTDGEDPGASPAGVTDEWGGP